MSIYRFGPFEVRTRVRELYRSGTKVRLRGQPFQLLEALLNHPGEVVTREQMRAELWPSDTFVDFEHGINASLRKLRQALGDSALNPLYIETLPGLGYRFIAPFEIIEEPLPIPKEGEPSAAQPLAAIEEDNESEHVEADSSLAWPRWIRLTLVAGVVVLVGLFLFGVKWNRRIVHGATTNPHNAQPAFSSPVRAPDAQAREGRAASSETGDSSVRSSGPINPGLSPIRGKVWVVSIAQASNVTFPPPNAVPDATFMTRGIAYIGNLPKNCYTLATFLADCATPAFELKFSGIPNPNLSGKAAGPDTAMSGDTWGILIEFIGSTTFVNGQEISILHDDGVALQIDGQTILGFDALPTAPLLESPKYTGPSGVHTFDLLYANAGGGGAWILFYPALF